MNIWGKKCSFFQFQKRKVCGLENCVNEAKSQYQESLKNLERISNEIHAQRKQGTTSEDSTSDILEEDPIKPVHPLHRIVSRLFFSDLDSSQTNNSNSSSCYQSEGSRTNTSFGFRSSFLSTAYGIFTSGNHHQYHLSSSTESR